MKQPKYKIDNNKLTRLVAKAQQGNEKATEEVVNMISSYLYYYSLGMLGDDEKARDAVQDVLVIMLQKLGTLENPQAFLGWIKMITANYCHNQVTRRRDNLSYEETYGDAEDDSEQVCPEKSAETKEVCAIVRGAVNALPLNQRESVLMFYFQQLSVRQIAETLGISENTVKSRLFAARQSLKKKLEACGGAALASCAVPPMKLISFSLISEAEEETTVLIPYTTPSGAVKVASAKSAAAGVTLPVKIAAVACAAVITAGGVGAVMIGASSRGKPTAPAPTAPVMTTAQPTTSVRTEPPSTAAITEPVTTVSAAAPTVVTTQAALPVIEQPTAAPATEAATEEPPTLPPEGGQKVVYFSALGWEDYENIYCYIYEKDGEPFYQWGSHRAKCTHYNRYYYYYDLADLNLKDNTAYMLIFTADWNRQTEPLEFTTDRYGDYAVLNGADETLGNVDSANRTYYIKWR